MTVCSIEGCGRKHAGKGYCGTHFQQFKRTGSPLVTPKVQRGCTVAGCKQGHHAHGLCGLHFARRARTGDPLKVSRVQTLDAFWLRVDKDAPDGHWLWTGEVQENGYGRISTRKRPTASGTPLAHRVAWELVNGPIVDDLVIDHVCRVKLCVRPHPDHLQPVTLTENVRRGLHGVLRTHCDYGHEMTPENTRYDAATNCRRCRTCARRWNADARARRRASIRTMYSGQAS